MSSDKVYFEVDGEEETLVLPSERKGSKPQKRFYQSKLFKWSLIGLLISLIYVFYSPVIGFFFDLLKMNPSLYEQYLYIEQEISNNTLKGLFYVAVLGSVFF